MAQFSTADPMNTRRDPFKGMAKKKKKEVKATPAPAILLGEHSRYQIKSGWLAGADETILRDRDSLEDLPHLLFHLLRGKTREVPARHEEEVDSSLPLQIALDPAKRLTEQALGAVAGHGVADLLGTGETDADALGLSLASLSGLKQDRGHMRPARLRGLQEIRRRRRLRGFFAQRLLDEVFRALAPGGLCYFAEPPALAMAELAAKNILAVLSGEDPPTPVVRP